MNKHMARTLSVAAAIAGTAFVLGGCGAGSVTGTPRAPGATAASAAQRSAIHGSAMLANALARRPNGERSWMKVGAAAQTLLYVSDIATASVDVFAYPKGTLVGTLTGFGFPQGLCSDASGNVYVTDVGNANIVEFAHGGTTPVATLDDSGQFPASCAVDPSTGNVAVANLLTSQNFNAGNIVVYPPGSSTGTPYSDPRLAREYFLTYDASGNIYVDGVDSSANTFRFAEMAPNGTFSDITLKGAKIGFPGGVQLNGSDIALVDQQGATFGKPDLYQVTTSGKAVGKTTLLTPAGVRLIDPVQFVFAAKSAKRSGVVTADALGAAVYQNVFPSGKSSASYTNSLVQPLGIAISTAAAR